MPEIDRSLFACRYSKAAPDYSWADTPVYMGPIHPRDKKPVGDRLARAFLCVNENSSIEKHEDASVEQ